MDPYEIRESLLRDDSVRDQIARRAYEIYAERGWGGREVEDWVQAESEVLPYLIEQERQRLAMEQAALEPEIQGEEPVSAVEPPAKKPTAAKKSSPAAKKSSPAAKSSASKAKSGKAPKKAAAPSKSAGKKTNKTAQP